MHAQPCNRARHAQLSLNELASANGSVAYLQHGKSPCRPDGSTPRQVMMVQVDEVEACWGLDILAAGHRPCFMSF